MANRLVVLLLLVSAFAFGADPAAVTRLLGGYEWHPDKAAFERLGPGTDTLLMQIAADKSRTRLMRQRAMAALSLYPNDNVFKWFETLVSSGQDAIMRRRAVDIMCSTFQAARSAAVVSAVSPLLGADDAYLRVRAAVCLREIGGTTANDALANYRRGIKAAWEAKAAGFKGADKP